MAGLVPQVGGVGVAAHCQQVEAVLPQPGDRPVAQPVHPAVEAGGQSCQGRHLHVSIEQDPELKCASCAREVDERYADVCQMKTLKSNIMI